MTPRGRDRLGKGRGYRIQRAKARNSPSRGANRNGKGLEGRGVACSFRKSLRASARGWGRPIRAILLGPFRSWI